MSRERKCTKTAAAIFVFVLGVCGCLAKAEEQPQTDVSCTANSVLTAYAEGGFETPEEAVMTYLAGLRDNDFGRMAGTFGAGNGAENISRQYTYLCGIDQIPEIESDNNVIFEETDEVEKFLGELKQKMEAADFSSLDFMGFIAPEELSDSYVEVYRKGVPVIAQKSGGSELECRVAAIRVNETSYLLFFDTIKKEDGWYNFQLGGILANMLDVEAEAAGTFRLDTADEKILGRILGSNSEELPEFGTAGQLPQVEGEGFDTPQEAAAAYLEGLKMNDMEQILGTFSVESYAENYNMQAYLEYMRYYSFLQQGSGIFPVNAFAKDMVSYSRKEQLKKDVLEQGNVLYFLGKYLSDSDITQEDAPFSWEELPEKIALDSIKILGFILPEEISENYSLEGIHRQIERQAEICGADQIEDCVIAFECAGGKYGLFLETAEYNGKWYNSQLGNRVSTLVDISSGFMGTAPLEMIIEPEMIEDLIMPIE